MAAETLRSATVSLTGMAADPVVARFDRSETVSIESTRYLGPVDDGRYVGLSDLRGDLDVARELLAGIDRVERYDVAGTGEHGIVYAHYRSAGLIGDLLSILYRNDIVVDWPIDHRPTDEPRTQLTVVGTAIGIRRAVAALPERVSLSVERVGQFDPAGDDALLTERQAALLDLAVREGYYEVPRGTTHRALAERLDLAPGTVSDRLQRVERRVMTAYAADGW